MSFHSDAPAAHGPAGTIHASMRGGISSVSSGPLTRKTIRHDGSNGMRYASVTICQDMGFAVLAVSSIDPGDVGDGDLACSDLLHRLVNDHPGN